MTSQPTGIRYGTAEARWVILATALGSGMAFLDSTVVNVALPAIDRELDAGFSGLQWTLDGYLLTLSSLLLLGGSLGDLYGRRRIFVLGLAGFTLASLACGLAPTTGALIVARALQGTGAALMVPGSLAIISAVFHPDDRAKAIGAWSGLSGVSTAVGPFLGGYLVDAVSWRWVFLLNLPLAVVVAYASLRHMPESRDAEQQVRRPDVAGA
ncbi:MAG: MFS transporter, partial [Actinomycetota bacterium]|nr:MFS transporter [Actinomycetota bacterium]